LLRILCAQETSGAGANKATSARAAGLKRAAKPKGTRSRRDTVRAIVTVTEVMVEKGRALLRIQCRVCECVVAEARLLLQSDGLKTV
jgi:hypothetical protein